MGDKYIPKYNMKSIALAILSVGFLYASIKEKSNLTNLSAAILLFVSIALTIASLSTL